MHSFDCSIPVQVLRKKVIDQRVLAPGQIGLYNNFVNTNCHRKIKPCSYFLISEGARLRIIFLGGSIIPQDLSDAFILSLDSLTIVST